MTRSIDEVRHFCFILAVSGPQGNAHIVLILCLIRIFHGPLAKFPGMTYFQTILVLNKYIGDKSCSHIYSPKTTINPTFQKYCIFRGNFTFSWMETMETRPGHAPGQG
jgi:hypothetical protein